MKTTGFIGGGRITRILLNGFLKAGVNFENIYVYETNEKILNAFKADFKHVAASGDDPGPAASSDWVFIALHPPVFIDALNTIGKLIRNDALVISLAPKITIEKMQLVLPHIKNLARMNPNAGTYVRKGFNPVCFAKNADSSVVREFMDVFEKLGEIPVVNENLIEAYAVISAMGHTYFWYQLQQLKELGVSYGLSENESKLAIDAMLRGTLETLFNSGLSFEEVTDLVPVKPMSEHEQLIKEFYKTSLNGVYQKIKPS